MGQYYTPVLIDADGTIRTLYSHDYGNGLKLMEHSYIGNDFIGAVLTQLWEHPQRLAWIGDYSNDYQGDLYETKLARNDFMKYYNAAWEDERDVYRIRPEAKPVITMRHKNRYLINHTQKAYIRIGEYIAANKWQEKGAFVRGKYDPFFTYDMCVHPLPLLTACGNDRGGGDYHSGYPDSDKVGLWAFDLIEAACKQPARYNPAFFHFSMQSDALKSAS